MTAGFSTEELVVRTRDGLNCILVEPFSFTRPSGEVITVQPGAASDGASSPRVLWPELPPFGTYWPAAFLHDELYRRSTYPKDTCDTIFKEALESLGVTKFDEFQLYEGVHLFGGGAFEEDRAEATAPARNLDAQQEEATA